MGLRMRLALGYSMFFALVLTLLSFGLYFVVQRSLINTERTELYVSADLLNTSFAASSVLPESYFKDPRVLRQIIPDEIEGLRSSALYVQVFTEDGKQIAASSNLQDQQLPIDDEIVAAIRAGNTVERVESIGGTQVLSLLRPLRFKGDIQGALRVAQSLYSVDQTMQILLIGMIVGNSVALITAARGGAWLARRALAPVDAISNTAQNIIHAVDLHQRVAPIATDDEIGHLTATINELLERLETLFTAQQRFIAEVSHELRTPLTAMRGNLELLQAGMADNPTLRDEALADMTQEVNRLARMANDLLLLAQTEIGIALHMQPVVLDDLLLEVYRELHPLATNVTLRVAVDEQANVPGDRDRIKQALLNLAANALQNTPSGGTVTLGLSTEGDCAVIAVRDTGPGIPADLLPHLFDRFYRGPKAQLRRTGGAGLGLAIVKWVAEAHHGRVEVESARSAGSIFRLYLPMESAETAIEQHG